MLIKETYYNDICVSYYHGLKSLHTIQGGHLRGFRYSIDTPTKDALKHFKNYLKDL